MPITFTEEDFAEQKDNLVFTEEDFREQPKALTKKRPDLIYSLAGTTPEGLARRGAEAESKGRKLRANILYGVGALQSAGRDLLTIPAHFFNQALLNYPRSAARTAGFEYPEEAESKIIGTAAKGAGIVGMAISPASRLLAKFGFAPRTARLSEKIARGAAGGAIAGGVYAPSEDIVGLKERAGTAAISGVAGAIIPSAIAGIKKIPKVAEKGKQIFRVLRGPNQSQIKADIGKIKSQIDIARTKGQQQKISLSVSKLAQEETLNNYLSEAKDMFNEHKKILTSQLDEALEAGTKNTRQVLRSLGSAASQTYGNTIETISDDLVRSGQGMAKGEFLNIYSNTLQKAQEGALPISRMGTTLDKIAKQFGISVDDMGNLAVNNPDEAINFKDFIAGVKTIRKGLSSNFRQGIGATPDDVVFDMFQDEYGKWIAQKVPKFAQLQAEYAPIAELKRQAGRIFKPYDTGEYKTSQAVNLLRKFGLAREGDKQGEKRLLDAIEKGFELQGQKIGGKKGMFVDIESLGQTLRELSEEKQYVTDALQQRLKEMKFTSSTQRLSAEKEIALRLEKLNAQKLTENLNLKNRADADRLVKWLVGLGLAGVGAKTYGLTRLTEH